MSNKRKIRALVLFSGGLDSTLAVKVLEKQNVDVTGLTFVSYFFDDSKAKLSAQKNNIKMRSVDFSQIHCEMVKSPKRGYGSTMNPCIDCHLLMIKEAGKIMRAEGFDLVATGEVLGQRPMSQNKSALKLIEKEAGLKGKLLRPLSAKLLEETTVEKDGLVDRKKLLDISGRSRKRQIELAKEFSLNYYPAPSGGCLLTEKEFGKKLEVLFQKIKNPATSDYKLLKIGRHFWLNNARIVVGRQESDNEKIRELKEKGDIIVELRDFMGPVSIIRGNSAKETVDHAKKLVAGYSRHTKNLNFRNLKFIIQ